MKWLSQPIFCMREKGKKSYEKSKLFATVFFIVIIWLRGWDFSGREQAANGGHGRADLTPKAKRKGSHEDYLVFLCCAALTDANIDLRLIQFFQTINNIRNVTYLLIG